MRFKYRPSFEKENSYRVWGPSDTEIPEPPPPRRTRGGSEEEEEKEGRDLDRQDLNPRPSFLPLRPP